MNDDPELQVPPKSALQESGTQFALKLSPTGLEGSWETVAGLSIEYHDNLDITDIKPRFVMNSSTTTMPS